MPRAGLNRDAVVALAVELVDETPDGFAQLTLAAVAAKAGVAVPSLYKHVGSLAELRREVTFVGVGELLRRSSAVTVGRADADALRSLGREIRRFAHERPGLYAASQAATPTNADDPRSVELDRASADTVAVMFAVLRGFGIPDDRAVAATRAARSAIHGFVALEAAGGFGLPDSVDDSFEVLLDVLVAGLRGLAA